MLDNLAPCSCASLQAAVNLSLAESRLPLNGDWLFGKYDFYDIFGLEIKGSTTYLILGNALASSVGTQKALYPNTKWVAEGGEQRRQSGTNLVQHNIKASNHGTTFAVAVAVA